MDIEEVAKNSPEAIIKEYIDPALGIQSFQALKVAVALGFTGPLLRQATKLITNTYKLFTSLDCSLVEINPLVVTTDDRVCALDAKFNFDDNALFRHPEISEMRDTTEEDPREVEAGKYNLNYIGLDGNIGCMVNGAGLAMATMDIIKYYGGDPANFLDVGGSATEEMVTNAFRILTNDKNVKALLVNIFGGIMRCDVIAQGIVAAAKTIDMKIPLVVRLEGTNVEIGKQILKDSGIDIIPADNLDDAAQKAVAAAK
jgi:succinyl-CoA synthetase beta subunit